MRAVSASTICRTPRCILDGGILKDTSVGPAVVGVQWGVQWWWQFVRYPPSAQYAFPCTHVPYTPCGVCPLRPGAAGHHHHPSLPACPIEGLLLGVAAPPHRHRQPLVPEEEVEAEPGSSEVDVEPGSPEVDAEPGRPENVPAEAGDTHPRSPRDTHWDGNSEVLVAWYPEEAAHNPAGRTAPGKGLGLFCRGAAGQSGSAGAASWPTGAATCEGTCFVSAHAAKACSGDSGIATDA